jgi:pimeloyl-ACP methyl ester carboxylesterase
MPPIRRSLRFAVIGCSLWVAAVAGQTAAPSRSDRFFNSGGVRIHYIDRGTGEPVVVLHGYAMSIPRMESAGVVDGLVNAGFRTIAVDCRGHGLSDKPHEAAKYGEEMARDVVRLLDDLKIQKTHLLGYSMGAIVSNKVRDLYPDRLQSVVIGGGGWHRLGEPALAGLKGTEIADGVTRTGSFEWMLRKFSENQDPPPTDADIRARNARMIEGNDIAALAAVMRAWDGFAVSESSLKANAVPTRAIVGGIDPLKAQVDEMARVMKGLDVVVIPGADHGALSDRRFTPAAIDFLKQHPLK